MWLISLSNPLPVEIAASACVAQVLVVTASFASQIQQNGE